MQQGSIPVINPLGETYPPDFNIQRTGLRNLTISSNNTLVLYTIESPLPGSWFAAAYLGDYIDDSITQKVMRFESIVFMIEFSFYFCSNCCIQQWFIRGFSYT